MKHKNFLRFSGGLLVATIFMALAACGGKGGGNNNNAPVAIPCGGNVACVSGIPTNNVGGNAIYTAESSGYYNTIIFNWSFLSLNGQPANQQPYQGGYQGYPQTNQAPYQGGYQSYQQPYSAYPQNNQGYAYNGGFANGSYQTGPTNYYGSIGVTGTLNISQVLNLGYCQIPNGIYTLNSVMPGTWGGTFVSNVRMQAIGPATINLSLTQGQLTSYGNGQPNYGSSTGRLFANVSIESVNGYACQMSLIVQ